MDNSPVEQMDESLDLRQYFSLFMHWSWLILLAALVAGTASFFISKSMIPIYESSTTVLVNAAPATKATDYSSVLLSGQLTTTYSQMMVNDSVLSQVVVQIGLVNQLGDIKKWITVTPVRNTQLIQVTVKTTDPSFSAKIANAVVTVFAAQIQEIESRRFSQSKVTLEAQLAEVDKQITTYSTQAGKALTIEEKDRLDAKVTQYRQIYSNLVVSYEQLRLSEAQSVSSVVQVESATPNLTPVSPKVMQNMLLAALVGLLLAAGVLVAREALDDTIKTPDDISRKFHLPVLGVINHHTPKTDTPITISEPRSPTAEAYRTLRTNVNYTSVDQPLQTLMITSAEPGEGKSTTVANLGVVMAQNGKKVIITDCDLRHPQIHSYFGLANHQGLSSLFAHSPEILKSTRQLTLVDNLTVVTTGSLPPNPAELMGSKKMQSILEAMCQSADVTLIDTPPILVVTDAAVLAQLVDGVLLVVRPGKTRINALRQTLEQLHKVNARVLGIVLNNVATTGNTYGYHKYYRNNAAYQSSISDKEKSKKG